MSRRDDTFQRLVLPKVSRTFAINISFLQGLDYRAICGAYLICRILDTIEDDPALSDQKKVKALRDFGELWTKKKSPKNFGEWGKKIDLHPLIQEEKQLIDHAEKVFQSYFALPQPYQKAISKPVKKMADGMAFFIDSYSKKRLKHLKDFAELEQYCYYVAGTVGELLTDIFCLHIKNTHQKKMLRKYSIHFAIGLQMVNILKDCWRDQKRNWLYIPQQFLRSHGMSAKDFYEKKDTQKCQKIYRQLADYTEQHLEKAISYLRYIPISLYRYRLFCLLPLAIALKTLQLLRRQNLKKNQKTQDKISRKNIRWLIAASCVCATCHTLTNFFCQSLKSSKNNKQPKKKQK